MKVAIHQPNFLPWQGVFYKIFCCDAFVFLDTVQFTKNGFQNRNRIKTPQGVSWITIPILSKGRFGQLTNEVKINNKIDWGSKIWKTICQNYSKAKYFNLYADFFEETFSRNWELLNNLNETILLKIMTWLDLNTQIIRASEMKATGKSFDLLLNICIEIKANTYISGYGGKNYMKYDVFKNSGIEIETYDFVASEYPQLHSEFIPNLSIIDLLFNCGPDSKEYILENRKIE